MEEHYKAYIEVTVEPENADTDGCVRVITSRGMAVWVPTSDVVETPHPLKENLCELRQALDAALSEKTCALNEASYWRERAQGMRDENLYLTGVVDAARSLSDLDLPERHLDAYGY